MFKISFTLLSLLHLTSSVTPEVGKPSLPLHLSLSSHIASSQWADPLHLIPFLGSLHPIARVTSDCLVSAEVSECGGCQVRETQWENATHHTEDFPQVDGGEVDYITVSTWKFEGDNVLDIVQQTTLRMNAQLLHNLNMAQELTCPEKPPLTSDLGTLVLHWKGSYSSVSSCVLTSSSCPWTCEETWVDTEKYCGNSAIVPLHHHYCQDQHNGTQGEEVAMRMQWPCLSLVLEVGEGKDVVLVRFHEPHKRPLFGKVNKILGMAAFVLVALVLVLFVWNARRRANIVVV